MNTRRESRSRTGSVYLAVLGTSLIVSVLALSALALQRVQNRILSAAADTQQAQLNAQTALELGLLTIKQDTTWRTTYANGNWFINRTTGLGTCSLSVTDPADASLTDDPAEPVVLVGIGTSGRAEQRIQLTLDFQAKPLTSLRSAVAAGDSVALTGCVLRASTLGLISANSISSTISSTVYGVVEATSISGTTYSGTTTLIDASRRPTMPDWATVFNYYRTNGTQINITDIPTTMTNNFGRNVNSANSPTSDDWIGNPPGIPTANVARSNEEAHNGTYSIKVDSRATYQAGAAQRMDRYIVPGQQYLIQAYVRCNSGLFKYFNVSIYTKAVGGTAQSATSANQFSLSGTWTPISVVVTAPTWTGNLEYAFFKIAGDSNNSSNFYVDELTVRENITGNLIYQKAIGPGVNPFGAANAQGIYWINCNGNKLVIDRSRIRGTLLVINPGVGSCVGPGPVSWSPAVAGYPALLVDADTASSADLTFMATNNTLSESVNGVNYNPAGCSSDDLGQDNDTNDTYASEIQGLIAVEDDLTFQSPCNAVVRGQIVVGDDISSSSGTLEIAYQPESLLNSPPGFTSTYQIVRRAGSGKKVVLP